MDKDIVIEVFKSKAADMDAEPCNYQEASFKFYVGDTSVYIELAKSNDKFFIQYESLRFEIEKKEFEELQALFLVRKELKKKIEDEKERKMKLLHERELMDMYKTIITKRREVLIEKIN